jgi:hypothetical protein
MRVGRIEQLPTAIFQMIQDHVNEKSYRNLMNANLMTFQHLKYETVRYTFKEIPVLESLEKTAKTFSLINQVKNAATQISLIYGFYNISLSKYLPHLKPLHRLEIRSVTFTSDNFASGLLNNISHIVLRNVSGEKPLKLQFKRLISLEMESCGNIESVEDLGGISTLKKLKITHCYIRTLSLVNCENLSSFTLDNANFELSNSIQIPESCLCIEITGLLVPNILQQVKEICELGRLQQLALNCNPKLPDLDSFDHAFYQNVPTVTLTNTGVYGDCGPSTNSIGCQEISLSYYSLIHWNSSDTIVNLRKLRLVACNGFEELPQMPKVETISLEFCNGINLIATIPSLIKLQISYCRNLKAISYCPKLRLVKITNCNSIEDISECTHVNTLKVMECPKLVLG